MALQDRATRTRHLLLLVRTTPGGLTAKAGGLAVGSSTSSAAGMLARLYWEGFVNRARVGSKYCYVPRPPRPPQLPVPTP
jgi:hypothetical protein